jgi:hypothetical protein
MPSKDLYFTNSLVSSALFSLFPSHFDDSVHNEYLKGAVPRFSSEDNDSLLSEMLRPHDHKLRIDLSQNI